MKTTKIGITTEEFIKGMKQTPQTGLTANAKADMEQTFKTFIEQVTK